MTAGHPCCASARMQRTVTAASAERSSWPAAWASSRALMALLACIWGEGVTKGDGVSEGSWHRLLLPGCCCLALPASVPTAQPSTRLGARDAQLLLQALHLARQLGHARVQRHALHRQALDLVLELRQGRERTEHEHAQPCMEEAKAGRGHHRRTCASLSRSSSPWRCSRSQRSCSLRVDADSSCRRGL